MDARLDGIPRRWPVAWYPLTALGGQVRREELPSEYEAHASGF